MCDFMCHKVCNSTLYQMAAILDFYKIWLQLLRNEHYYLNVHAGKPFTYILAALGIYKSLYIAIVWF